MDKDKSTYIISRFKDLLGIVPTDEQVEKLLKFYDMTIEKNQVMNLTAITDFEEFVIKHFVDSVSIVKVLDLKSKKIKVIDIGTGAGFPGIPLKIMFPELDITLFDSLQKRLSFLDEVIEKLKLDKICTVHGRAEEFGRKLDYREKYDIVVSRAVAELTTLCELALPFCKVGGSFISYKGVKGNEELTVAKKAIITLGGKVSENINFVLQDGPGCDAEKEKSVRNLIKIDKVKPTDHKYPRGGGKPFKAPLYIDGSSK